MIPSPVLREQGVKMSGFPGCTGKFRPFYSGIWLKAGQHSLSLCVCRELWWGGGWGWRMTQCPAHNAICLKASADDIRGRKGQPV